MAVITIPDQQAWIVARWAFEQLLDRAEQELGDAPALRERLEAAKALDGLHLAGLPVNEREVITGAVARAAMNLELELEASPQDKLGQSFIAALHDLIARVGYPA